MSKEATRVTDTVCWSVTAIHWGQSDCGLKGPTVWPLVLDSGPGPDLLSPAQRYNQLVWKWIINRQSYFWNHCSCITKTAASGARSKLERWDFYSFQCTPNLNVPDVWHRLDKSMLCSNNLSVSCKCFPVNKQEGYQYLTGLLVSFYVTAVGQK